MTKSTRTDRTAPADTESAAEFESWLRKGARAPNFALARMPEKGQVVGGKYRIEAELGAGGMGAVFRATHIVSDKAVALKWMLRPATDERALQRFTREARAAGRIDHPNVVDVYDIGHEGDASYLVMELLHGESLRKRVSEGPIAPAEAVDLLLPALRGVAAAHREGVVHRDLKPDNIFLCRGRDGAPRPAKVLDFGISTITSPDLTTQSALTTEGTLLGTPSYMAPEQFKSASDADARTDIYAFGVILYEALTGRVPFDASSFPALVLAISQNEPRKPRELRPEISAELQRVVLRAMQKDPTKRYQAMESMISALLPFASSAQAAGSSDEYASVERVRVALPQAPFQLVWLVFAAAGLMFAVSWWWLHARSRPTLEATPTPPPSAAVQATITSALTEPPAPLPTAPVSTSEKAPEPATATPSAAPPAAPRKRALRRTAEPEGVPVLEPKPSDRKPIQPPGRPRVGSIHADEL